jgi:uncharacterized NAD-dependent epimerase/dehydratase family protein
MKNNVSDTDIKIAVIDTGVDSSHPEFSNIDIKQYYFDNGIIKKSEDSNDDFGHGTACAWLIHRISKSAEIISFKCLDKNGISDGKNIIEAIRWCIKNKIDIINLSFGAINNNLEDEFKAVGELAYRSNVLIFASCHDSGYLGVPAKLKNYIPVWGKSVKGKQSYYYLDNRFITHGGRQRVAWTNPLYIFVEGSSFATSRMVGIAALLKAKYKNSNNSEIVKMLIQNAEEASCEKILPVQCDRVSLHNSDSFPIKKAVIFSFTKEMHHLIKFNDLTNIEITGIVDLPFKSTINKHLSDVIADVKKDIKITSNLESALSDCDTVIISRTSLYEGIIQKDILKDALSTAIKFNKNIFSLEYIDVNMFPDIFEEAKKKKIKIRHPIINMENANSVSVYRQLYGHISNSTPIVGIFGTGVSQGKFTVQLSLRRIFLQLGYNVCNYGTETHSELFGFEGFYPLEMEKSIRTPDTNMIEFIQGDLRRIEIEMKPDIIFVGGQSGTVPFSYSTNSREFTLPTLSFLMATIPHTYILTINLFDGFSYIRDTINVIEGLGKAKIIAFATSKRTKKENSSSMSDLENIDDEEYNLIIKKLYSAFQIPTYDVADINDQKMLTNLIIKYFS